MPRESEQRVSRIKPEPHNTSHLRQNRITLPIVHPSIMIVRRCHRRRRLGPVSHCRRSHRPLRGIPTADKYRRTRVCRKKMCASASASASAGTAAAAVAAADSACAASKRCRRANPMVCPLRNTRSRRRSCIWDRGSATTFDEPIEVSNSTAGACLDVLETCIGYTPCLMGKVGRCELERYSMRKAASTSQHSCAHLTCCAVGCKISSCTCFADRPMVEVNHPNPFVRAARGSF